MRDGDGGPGVAGSSEGCNEGGVGTESKSNEAFSCEAARWIVLEVLAVLAVLLLVVVVVLVGKAAFVLVAVLVAGNGENAGTVKLPAEEGTPEVSGRAACTTGGG